jgi:ethanolamine kinase
VDSAYRSTWTSFHVWILNLSTGETISHSLLARYHLAPPLLARFDNGLMYEFIQGRVCTSEDLSREPIRRGVARKLGEWHSVLPIASVNKTKGTDHTNGVPASDVSCPKVSSHYQRIKSATPGKVAPNLWTVLQKWILALPRETEAQMKRNDLLQVELGRIVNEFGNLRGLGKDGVCSKSTRSNFQALLIALAIARLRSLRSSFRQRYCPFTTV